MQCATSRVVAHLVEGDNSSSLGLGVLLTKILGLTHLRDPCRGGAGVEMGFWPCRLCCSPSNHAVLDGETVSYESPHPQN